MTFLAYIPFMKTFYEEIQRGFGEMNFPFMVINFCIALKIASMIFEVLDLKITQSTGHASDVLSFIAQSTNYLS